MVARHLESNGIPTVVLGSAIDIVEYCRVPRFYFVDYPLGNPCGKPYDTAEQAQIVADALELFSLAVPVETQYAPNTWGSDEWRENYMRIKPEDVERLRAAGLKRKRERARLRETGQVRKD